MRSVLVPFQKSLTSLDLVVDAHLNGDRLELSYDLKGDLSKIALIDQPLIEHQRRHEIWKSTCFEWFLKSKDQKNYWEFNANPCGDWNFYSLDDYRKNLSEELALAESDIHWQAAMSHSPMPAYHFHLTVSLHSLFSKYPQLRQTGRLAITSVIKLKSGEVCYFSLKHPTEKPDFHSNEGFLLSLQELK